MNRSESKYFATAARMDAAFLELIAKKDFAFITVSELCQAAGVNRSTFYLHYETMGDLLAECSERLIDDFVQHMPYDTREFLQALETRPLEELYLITPEYLTPYLQYIRENRRVFRATVEHAAALRMDEAYLGLNRHILTPILRRFGVPPEDQKYLLPFFMNGLVAILKTWLEGDCRDSIEHVSAVIQRCIPRLAGR